MICERCDALTSKPHRTPQSCLTALWNEARALEREIAIRDPWQDEEIVRAIAAPVETPADEPIPQFEAKPAAKRRRTRVLRAPSPAIDRSARREASLGDRTRALSGPEEEAFAPV